MVHRTLLIQTAFIGDVILTTPLIHAIKSLLPDTKIDVIVVPNTKNVLENNPNIYNIIEYDKRGRDKGLFGFLKLASRLRRNKYNLVLLPHRSLRSALLALLIGSKQRTGFDKSSGSFLYTKSVVYDSSLHEVDRNLKLLVPLGGKNITGLGPQVYPNENDSLVVKQFLGNYNNPAIAVAPGSVWATKKWPEQHYSKLVKDLTSKGNTVIMIGGPDDAELCERIASNADGNVLNLAGKLSLRQSAAALKECKALICNDSGTLHLGVSVNTRVIAIFGPTVPAFGFYPYGKGHTVLEQKGLDCRPCAIHGGKKCPIGTHICMQNISPQYVLDTVLRVI